MKTYDVYKLAIEEGKTRFKRKADGLVYRFDEDYALKLRPENQSDKWYQIKLDEEWEEVKEPVSFIEAAKEVRMSNKRIKVRHKLYISGFMMLTDLLDEIVNEIGYEAGSIVVAKILTEGKFYIED